ncbi:MAG: hypothetical protein P9M03_05830 [Candidatus Theseobacter exili]|nr:hypothetical protein [Candidatus Theseobacter exili]
MNKELEKRFENFDKAILKIEKNEELERIKKREVKKMKKADETMKEFMDKIYKNNQAFKKERDAIREDEKLSEIGKSEELTATFKKYTKVHAQLKVDMNLERESLKRDLFQEAYAPNQKDLVRYDVIMNKLENIQHEDQLDSLINRADKTNDNLTLNAMLLFTAEKGYRNASNKVRELLPEKKESLDTLYNFQSEWGDLRDSEKRFAERIYSSGPFKPEEVGQEFLVYDENEGNNY